MRDIDVTGSDFKDWSVERAPLKFTLSYASSHSVETGSMSVASAANFKQQLQSLVAKRNGVIGSELEVEIAPLRSADELSALTGYSPTTQPYLTTLRDLDFRAPGGRSTVLMTLTSRAFDVDVELPSSLSEREGVIESVTGRLDEAPPHPSPHVG